MSSLPNNLFVGSTIGSLKGINVKRENGVLKVAAKNLIRDKANLSSQHEIKTMNWSDEHRDEILIGSKSSVQSFSTINNALCNSFALPENECCGIFKSDEKIFVGITSGSLQSVSTSKNEPEWTVELKMNQCIERLRRCYVKTNIVATGGKNNDLKLWDLNTKQITFNAKNVKPDELQLQIPLWISDIAFCQQTESVSTCSRHGYVRLYDPLLPQRRPVFNAHQDDQVFTCITCAPAENQFLVGSGTGDLFLVDVRGKNPFVGKYKSFTGAVKEIICPPRQSLVFSVSLDRHFRIHDFSTRKLLLKEYLHTRLTTILPREPFVVEEIETVESEAEESTEPCIMSDHQTVIKEEDVKVTDNLFDKMEKIDDGSARKSSLRLKKKLPETDASEDGIETSQKPKRIKWKKNV
ncbi:hypothetical protein V9T40_007304 [Parthenolecanium corni]|uniref:WD repeat-containing protein 74 n=1 Tax=Parthenolecanium corni TaxID=536013 RepID=A0AAN9TY72_9HEMI